MESIHFWPKCFSCMRACTNVLSKLNKRMKQTGKFPLIVALINRSWCLFLMPNNWLFLLRQLHPSVQVELLNNTWFRFFRCWLWSFDSWVPFSSGNHWKVPRCYMHSGVLIIFYFSYRLSSSLSKINFSDFWCFQHLHWHQESFRNGCVLGEFFCNGKQSIKFVCFKDKISTHT